MSTQDGDKNSLILDTSAFISGYGATDEGVEHYTVPAVAEEISEGSFQRIRFENMVSTGRLKVVLPDARFDEELQGVLREMGEEKALSRADAQILALGLQLRENGAAPVIVSDDYSIQNVADRLNLTFRTLTTHGISRRYRWITYCPGCKKTYPKPPKGEECPICGTKLKKKPHSERQIK